MTVTTLKEIRAVTANYFFWQGLRWVPMGVALMFTAAAFSPGLGLPAVLATWAPVPLMLVALWLSTSVLGSYYRRTFGAVAADPSLHVRRSRIKWFVVYPIMMMSMIVDVKLAMPVLVSALVWGLAIELYRRSTGGGRMHYVFACMGLCALAFLPLAGAAPSGKDGVTLVIGVTGAIYIIGGLLDHSALVRVLGPVE